MAWAAPLDDAVGIWTAEDHSSGTIPEANGTGMDATITGGTYTAGSPDYIDLDGTNDYISISHHADLDLTGTSNEITILVSCYIDSGTTLGNAIVAKKNDVSNNSSGYGVRIVTGPTGRAVYSNGVSTTRNDTGTGITTNVRDVQGAIWKDDTASDSIELVEDGSLTGSPDTSSITSTSNTEALTVGTAGAATAFTQMRFYGMAIWHRALSQSEIDAFEAALDAGPTGGDTTLTPGALATAYTIPAPTIAAGEVTLTPAATSSTFSIPVPTILGGTITVNPTPLASTFAIPAPAVSTGDITLTPSPVVMTSAAGDTENVVHAVLAVTGAYTLPPATGILTSAKTVTPAPLVMTGILTFEAGTTQGPDAVSSTFTLPAPTINQELIVFPSPVSMTATVVGPNYVEIPASLQALFSMPSPQVIIAGGVVADPAVATFSIPVATLISGQPSTILSPSSVVIQSALPKALGSVNQILSVNPLVISLSIPTATAGTFFELVSPTKVEFLGGRQELKFLKNLFFINTAID